MTRGCFTFTSRRLVLFVSHVDTFRASWTSTRSNEDILALDSTVGAAFLAGYIPVQCNETLRVAEVFFGGFCGWTQAGFCLREAGVKVRST